MRRLALVLTAALAAPGTALAAGFEVPDNGTTALSQGGAFAAEASDPSAIYYNPAGVASLTGFQVLIDGNLLNHSVAFQRKDCVDGKCTAPRGVAEVSNAGGTFFAPFLGITYSMELSEGSALGFGIGAYGPSAVGKYNYPKPDYAAGATDPRKNAAQRYALIDSSVLIVYPTLTAAYRYKELFSVGGSLQYVFFDTEFTQTVTDSPTSPEKMQQEDGFLDSLVNLKATGGAVRKLTGILGAQAKLGDRFTVGAAFRPGFRIHGEGKLTISPSGVAKALNAKIEGDKASLDLTMPNQARVGVMFKIFDGFTAELDGVYERWSSTKEFVITPEDITVNLGSTEATKTKLAPIVVKKGFQDAYSARLGLAYKLPLPTLPVVTGVTVRAGGFYETSAIPNDYTNIDFANWERTGETFGLTVALPYVDLQLAGAFVQQPDREVTNSQVFGAASDPSVKPFPIGNGTYKASYANFSVGLRGHF